MRLLFSLLLTLVFVCGANATVVDIVTGGDGNDGHAGTAEDPLTENETIGIKLVLNDGFWLSSMDFSLQVSGPATLSIEGLDTKVGTIYELGRNSAFAFFSDGFVVDANGNVSSNSIDKMTGGAIPGIAGPDDIVWNMNVTCTGSGDVPIALSLTGQSDYSDTGAPGSWEELVQSDLGGLTIYQEAPSSYTLTSSVDGVGGTIDPCGSNDYTPGATVQLTAVPSAGYEVDSWSSNVTVAPGDPCQASIVMDGPKTVSVTFASIPAATYTLTSSVDGDGGTIDPCGSNDYTPGVTVQLTAVPSAGYEVDRWSSNVTVAPGDPCQASIVMDGPKTVSVTFAAIPAATYTLTSSVDGGVGTIDPSGSNDYTPGATVQLTAVPSAGYEVDRWSSNVTVAPGDPCQASIVMDGPKTVSVTFAAIPAATYTLTSSVDGGVGTIDPSGSNDYAAGATVQLTAVPNADYEVDGWSSNVTVAPGDPCQASIVMDGPKTVSVTFELIPSTTYTLNTSVVNQIGGQIDVTPPGGTYADGTTVALTAVPDDGWEMIEWSSNIDPGSDTADPCLATVTMDSNEIVTAQFALSEPMTVSKMTVKADKQRDDPGDIRDSFTASGTLGSEASRAMFANADSVTVRILAGQSDELVWPESADEIDPCDDFRSSRRGLRRSFNQRIGRNDPGGLSLVKFDFGASPAKFWLAGKNVDLTGLKPPMTLEISIGSYTATTELTDDDVNRGRGIPLILLSGEEDVVRSARTPRVDRKQTSFTLLGEISAKNPDVELDKLAVALSWGLGDPNDKVWAIPIMTDGDTATFRMRGTRWIGKHTFEDRSKVVVTIDFIKGTFKVTIRRDTEIPVYTDSSRFQMTWEGFAPDPDAWQ